METETKTEAARGEGVAFAGHIKRESQQNPQTEMVDDRLRALHAAVEEAGRSSRGRRSECTGEHGHLGIWNVVVVCPVLPGTAFDIPAVCLTHIGICLPVPKQNKLQQSATRGGRE